VDISLADPEGGPGGPDPPPPFEIHLYFFLFGKENIMTSQEEGVTWTPSFDILFMFHIKEQGMDFYF
jgi:hypothetical protein